MPDYPHQLKAYIIEHFTARRSPAYVLLDSRDRVVQCGGALDKYCPSPLTPGDAIADKLLFMEGLLPLDQPQLHLPSVKIQPQMSVDIHILRLPEGHGLLLLDTTDKENALRRFQQETNEQALVRDTSESLQQSSDAFENDAALSHFLSAIDIAALTLFPDGTFRPAAQLPHWIERFCPDLKNNTLCRFDPGNHFSFLENFIDEAHAFWQEGYHGCLKSGIWIETDENGDDHLFDATAVNAGSKKWLLIQKGSCTAVDKQQMIQKGRELALDFHALSRMQQALKITQNELEKRVAERTHDLQAANQQLADELAYRKQLERERSEIANQLQQSQKMEAIGTLAGGIAHDFNNILSAVIGFTELSLDDSQKDSDQRYNLNQVLSAAERAKDLIRQILTFSRQSRQEPKPVQFQMIAAEVMKLLRATLPATIEIVCRLESNAYVFADQTQLHQVLLNLCTNAGQSMQADGGVLTVRLTDIDAGKQLLEDHPDLNPGPHIKLIVKDSGHGMTPEVMARIFDPFFTTKEKGEGTGMGLSVVHGIVKGCGGSIAVESRPGKGSEFLVLLPAVQHPSTSDDLAKEVLPAGNERILMVDDEVLQTELVTQLLGRLGYRVVTSNDSIEALERFAATPDQFDLVITDLTMPKMTGKALALELLKLRPDLPIILCSGYSEGMTGEKVQSLGIRSYLMKPIAVHELAKTVRRVLDESFKPTT